MRLVDVLDRELAHAPPEGRALAVGAQAEELLSSAGYPRLHRADDREALAALRPLAPFWLALAASPAARLGPAAASVLVGQVRDLYARRSWVLVTEDDRRAGWGHADLMGLGFSSLGEVERDTGSAMLYGFDIATYKTTPDWLNASNWANPRLYGKHRW